MFGGDGNDTFYGDANDIIDRGNGYDIFAGPGNIGTFKITGIEEVVLLGQQPEFTVVEAFLDDLQRITGSSVSQTVFLYDFPNRSLSSTTDGYELWTHAVGGQQLFISTICTILPPLV